ncbi:MAG: site-specific integrase [Gemmatimonas sp.]
MSDGRTSATWLNSRRGLATCRIARQHCASALRVSIARQHCASALRVSIARQLSAVRSLYRWMHRDERVDINPARGPLTATPAYTTGVPR